MKRSFLFLSVAFLLVACARDEAAEPARVATDAAPTSTDASAQAESGIMVSVDLSPEAHARLRALKESVIVTAEYFGFPGKQAIAQHVPGSENPWMKLQEAQVELSGKQLDDMVLAHFDAVTLDASKLALTDDPSNPKVSIHVYSGRRADKNNLLDCSYFQDTLVIAREKPVEIDCKLIGE